METPSPPPTKGGSNRRQPVTTPTLREEDGMWGSPSPTRSGVRRRQTVTAEFREDEGFWGSARRRIFHNMKRKFWDSNEVLSHGAVIVRDLLATVYNSGRDKAMTTAQQTVEVYSTCKDWSNEAEFPRYLIPLRDHVLLPTFHGVEGAVQWLASDRVPELYMQVKATGARLPLGQTVIIPYVNTVENVVGYSLTIMRAPFPSKETVVYGVETGMELTKQGLGAVARETYYYVQLVDVQITRTLTRAQWDILGYGPYAELSEGGKQLVIDHTCVKYLSLKHPLRRYEFLALIRWHNGPLYQALVETDILKERGGLKVEMDLWLNADAPWRQGLEYNLATPKPRTSKHTRPKSMSDRPIDDSELPRSNSMQRISFPSPSNLLRKRPFSHTVERARPFWYHYDENQEGWVLYPAHENQRLEISYQRFKEFGGLDDCETILSKNATLGLIRNKSLRELELLPNAMCREPHGCGCGCGCPSLPECFCGMGCVVVDEGRYTVSLKEMRQYPVYWRPQGAFVRPKGERVRRATWFEATKLALLPFSEGAATILEDAYRFLKWWLSNPIGRHRITPSGGFCPSEELIHDIDMDDPNLDMGKDSPGVLLTVQVGMHQPESHGLGLPGAEDQWVQFRSLKEIYAVRKTLAGAIWARTRRVYRGTQAIGRQQVLRRQTSRSAAAHNLPALSDGHMQMCYRALSTKTSDNKLPPHIALKETAKDLDTPVDHLVLVVHGIGEALENIDVMGLLTLRSLIECCEDLRNQHIEVMETSERLTSPKASPECSDDENEKPAVPKDFGRVEFLPVEWHSRLHGILKQGNLMNMRNGQSPFNPTSPLDPQSELTIDDITLPRIPHLRSFLNDTAMDILYFMSPPYHQLIIDEVTKELNRIYKLFCQRTANFSGKVSIAAHSLGSIISFDILANQENQRQEVRECIIMQDIGEGQLFEGDAVVADFLGLGLRQGTVVRANQNGSFDIVYDHGAKEINVTKAKIKKEIVGAGHINIKKHTPSSLQYSATKYPPLKFKVENLFCMGSPIGMFLMIRNQHRTLDQHYCLPGCHRMFNIFHPYDPVAFRIEPFLTGGGRMSEDPEIVPTWTGGLRVQYKVKRLRKDLWDRIFAAKNDLEHEIEAWFERVGLMEKDEVHVDDDREYDPRTSDEEETNHNTYGMLAGGLRIDYTLQEKEIEVTNEYIFAITAHVLYWQSKDLSLFMARHLYDTTDSSHF